MSTNADSRDSLSPTLGTRERVARNCSCAISKKPMEADGLRNVESPGGGGLLNLLAPFPA